ncbi:MAG: riboflavin kinase / adenylyltransferase [Thermoleophilaceae bacterium]|jgi:riboflavin kinase/FMN adenylyltransferase|nr:riboflavin kinase / adenylyltransferase [Thermoleophilaceae bacterium]
MNVIRLPDLAEQRERRVAVGTFDGVHVGHREVIRGCDTVLTFDPHPLSVIRPEAAPKLITPFTVKRDIIGGLGVQELVVIPFDEGFREKTAEQFIDEVLIGALGAVEVSVGENFSFGKRARGTVEMLRARSEFETRVAPLVEVDGETVSSTQIRALVASGDVEKAARMLGGPFIVEGQVAHGDKRGRTLGFPTANLVPDELFVHPGHGVYAGWSHGHAAAVNVGVRPQFQTGRGLLIEAYLIDFDGDLYGETLRIAFAKRLRGERRFESVDALVEQMGRDVAEAEQICAAATFPAA